MTALIVIDMQDEYVGRNRKQKRNPYNFEQLVDNINSKITDYEQRSDTIIYIKNKRKFSASGFVPELRLASDLVFEKNRASCFSNNLLLSYLMDKAITKIELAGVDGNFCVGMSALDGAKKGFSIRLSLSCIGVANTQRFLKTQEKLAKANISIFD